MGANLRLLLLLCSLFAAEAMVGRCAHDEMQPTSLPREHYSRVSPDSRLSAFSRAWNWEPIRIQVFYGPLNTTERMKERLQDAVSGAINWFQRTLKVRPISGPFRFKLKKCGRQKIRGSILEESIEADFALYVFSDMEKNGLAGFATACELDAQTGQPVKGLFYFNARTHERLQDEQVLATVIHELTHALGFSNGLFQYYRKSDGSQYSEDQLFVKKKVRGYSVTMLALPTVTQKAREAFNCPSLMGVELEGAGGAGTKGSHWEKRVMYNDYMVADAAIYDIVYSDISVALLQDSGWYQVSYQYANPIQWGAGKGCEFLTEKCVKDSKALSSEFCTIQRDIGCDFLNLRKSRCSATELREPLPAEFQYFNSPTFGSPDIYVDSCPVMRPFSDGDCRDRKTLWMDPRYGETPGLHARCINWFVDEKGSTFDPGCYQVNCDNELPLITVGNSTWECPVAGGPIEIQSMKLLCPPRTQLCRDVPCVNNCYGFGSCHKGVCKCEDRTDRCNYMYLGGRALAVAVVSGLLILM